jgi:Domain of unknown function (DUF4328)
MTTASSSSNVVPSESGRDRLGVVRGAAVSLYALLSVNIVVAAVSFSDELDRHSLYERAKSKPWTITLGEVHAAQERIDSVHAITIGVLVATGVAFAIWLWAAYSRLGALGYERRYGSGWALGAWFLPIANLFIPKRIVNDLVDADVSRRGVTTETVSLRRWATAWWTAWLVSLGVGFVTHGMENNAKTIDDALGASTAYMVRDVVFAVAAVLAIFAVVFVTHQQRELTSVR